MPAPQSRWCIRWCPRSDDPEHILLILLAVLPFTFDQMDKRVELDWEQHRRRARFAHWAILAGLVGLVVLLTMTLLDGDIPSTAAISLVIGGALYTLTLIHKQNRLTGQLNDELSALGSETPQLRQTLAMSKKETGELKEALDNAKEAAKAQKRMIGYVSHEIRSPINAIVGYTEILAKTNLDEEASEHAEMILHESKILLTLVDDLLEQAKYESGHAAVVYAPMDFHAVFNNITRSVALKAKEKGLDFETAIAEGTPRYVVGDALRLRQILTNIIQNAIKFTDQGAVKVAVEPLEQRERQVTLRFSVEDTGVGMEKSQWEKIFDRFYQADAERRSLGAGLGMSIAKTLVEQLESEIHLTSEVGQGSKFWFDISLKITNRKPNLNQSYAALRAHADTARKTDTPIGRVLVADDSPDSQIITRHHLENAGYSVKTVADGQSAVAACQVERFNLVLMDMEMPKANGIEATRQIRALKPPQGSIPIIAMSAYASDDVKKACLDAGMNDAMSKPIRHRSLLRLVRLWTAPGDKGLPRKKTDAKGKGTLPPGATRPEILLPLDYKQAVGEFGGNRELVNTVIHEFVGRLEGQLASLKTAYRADDLETIWREAHKIRGGAINLVAYPLATALKHLEMIAKNGSEKEKLADAIGEAEKEMNKLISYYPLIQKGKGGAHEDLSSR